MISSIELLPQSPGSQMLSKKIKLLVLQLKFSLLEELEKAMDYFFQQRDLRKFDPHVGETSCQIRACQILLLVDEIENSHFSALYAERMKEISLVKNQILATIELVTNIKPTPKRLAKPNVERLNDFFNTHQCSLMLHKHEYFLLHAHILTNFRKVNGIGDICVDYEKIYSELGLSKSLARKLVHVYQIRLAEWSCEFVKDRLKYLPELNDLESVIAAFECIDDDARKVLPCFHMTEVLIHDLIRTQKNIAVVIERRNKIAHLDNIILFFELKSSGQYEYSKKVKNKPCFIVYGTMVYQDNDVVETHAEYVKRFIEAGVVNVLLANMAIHPQYTGLTLLKHRNDPYSLLTSPDSIDKISALKERYLKYLDVALKIGCGKNNPDLLFIRHINCDRPFFN